MTEPLLDVFRHNTWANESIVDFCATQPQARLDTPIPGTYGSARATLMHLLAAEEGYLRRLGADGLDDRLDQDGPFPGFEELRRRASRNGEAFLGAARSAAYGPTFEVEGEGHTYEVSTPLLLVQAINHGNEHRAHILTALSAQGADPIEISGWEWGMASGAMVKRA